MEQLAGEAEGIGGLGCIWWRVGVSGGRQSAAVTCRHQESPEIIACMAGVASTLAFVVCIGVAAARSVQPAALGVAGGDPRTLRPAVAAGEGILAWTLEGPGRARDAWAERGDQGLASYSHYCRESLHSYMAWTLDGPHGAWDAYYCWSSEGWSSPRECIESFW